MGTVVAPGERRELGLASDHELVAAVRLGEDRAFEALYQRYQRRIAAYVYGMVNDYGRAEDITQEVFISALRRMRETERPIAFKPWIYEIAKNACIDQFRRSRRAEEVSYDADEGIGALESAKLAALDGGPDAVIDAKQQLDHLCGAFGSLSETHHEILVLRELEGLSYREIGERMGLSRPSVESTLFRARRRLTEEYDELVSGQRCLRIRGILDNAGSLGARDQRRLQRHIAHCQPCRREARLAGVDTVLLTRPGREVVTAKVAAVLPLPFLFKDRKGDVPSTGGSSSSFVASWAGPLSTMAEPVAQWSKALAAAAVVLIAGAGAGAATRVGSAEPTAAEPATPAVERTREARRSDRNDTARPARLRGAIVTRRAGGRRGAVTGGNRTGSSGEGLVQTGAAAPPAAADAPPGSTAPAVPGPPSEPRVVPDDPSPRPEEAPVQPVQEPLTEVENGVRTVDGGAGDTVGSVRALLDGGQ